MTHHQPQHRPASALRAFLDSEASGGLLLMAAAVLAMIVANSPLEDLYHRALHMRLGPALSPRLGPMTLHAWINDGLMAIFFLLVGLEIKRELIAGELSNMRAAALPIIAALGGVLLPAAIFVLVFFALGGSMQSDALSGWAVPMATDIAFALGCLALLGSRIPFTLKIFLTAVAIVDDMVAVLIIAFFYSSGIYLPALALGLIVLLILAAANLTGIRVLWFYLGLGVIVWWAFLESGIHATIAGVLVALTIPARHQINEATFLARAQGILRQFEQSEAEPTPMLTDERQQSAVLALEDAAERVQAPLQKLEHILHTPVMFIIMPLFAFANAGVKLSTAGLTGEALIVALGIALGLLLGKPLGIMGASWLAVRSGIASLPAGVTWQHLFGASILAGIGFTMSLFIASLGFGEGSVYLDAAKLAILGASTIAGTVGFFFLRRIPPPR